jgi:hypothetical protein
MPKSEFELVRFEATAPCAKIVVDPMQAEARLQELSSDLSLVLLREVVQNGLGARNDTTRASAVIAAGVQQWLKTVEGLRTRLSDKQWHIHDEKNCPFISSPDRSVSFVVMTGNNETGKQGFEDPTNQAEKGVVVEGFVQSNNQLELFNQDSFRLAQEKRAETQVWAFLYHYDKKLNEVRFELSYPTGFDNKKITTWGERIILGSIPNNPKDFPIRKDTPNAPATVDVEPKSGTLN